MTIPTVAYRTVKIDGLDIFYREAGPKDAPTILLLHGFPTSSHMFRNLISALADEFHLVAPDYPGFGRGVYATGGRCRCQTTKKPDLDQPTIVASRSP